MRLVLSYCAERKSKCARRHRLRKEAHQCDFLNVCQIRRKRNKRSVFRYAEKSQGVAPVEVQMGFFVEAKKQRLLSGIRPSGQGVKRYEVDKSIELTSNFIGRLQLGVSQCACECVSQRYRFSFLLLISVLLNRDTRQRQTYGRYFR